MARNDDALFSSLAQENLMQDFSASPREIVISFWRNHSLIFALSKREVMGRYRGSYFGIFWSFINPLFMLIIYTFVFSVIFKARWNVESDSRTEYALILFAGLLIFNLFSECITKAPSLILSNANYVKKVVFPLEILPWVNLYSALFHGLISLIVWLLAYAVFFGAPHVTIIYLPLIVLPFCLIVMGLSWIFASIGVYLRDIGQIIGIAVAALMFLSPIFYPITSVPVQFQKLMLINPITIPVQVTRDFLFWGIQPEVNLMRLVFYWGVSLMIAAVGFFWFQKTRKGFADVL
jgi:lipopolysaccharide transport system permease protein